MADFFKTTLILVSIAFVRSQVVQGNLINNQTCGYYQNFTFNGSGSNIFMNTSFDLNTTLNNLNIYQISGQHVLTYNPIYDVYKVSRIWKNMTSDPAYSSAIQLPQSFVNQSYVEVLMKQKLSDPLQYLIVPFKNTNSGKTYHLIFFVNESGDSSKTLEALLQTFQLQGSPSGVITILDTNGNIISYYMKPVSLFLNGIPSDPNFRVTENFPSNSSSFFKSNCLLNEYENNVLIPALNEEYKINRLAYDWGFWYMVCGILGFMLVGNWVEENLDYDDRMKDNWRTFFPFYSLWYCASEIIFTPRIRLGIMFLVAASIGWFNGLMVYLYIQIYGQPDVPMAYRLALFPFCSSVFSLFFAFFGGVMANYYYKCHRDYIDKVKSVEEYSVKEKIMEEYEEISFSRLHIFYFSLGILSLFFFVMTIWFVYYKILENQGWWLLQVVIGLGWKWLVWDVIFGFMGKLKAFYGMMKLGGYWFDYDLHEDFKQFYKTS